MRRIDRLAIQPAELRIDPVVFERIVGAIGHSETSAPEIPIDIEAVWARSKADPGDVKKVLYFFLHAGRLLPSFKPHCKSCGYLGDMSISEHQINSECPGCHDKVAVLIDFWVPDHRPDFSGCEKS